MEQFNLTPSPALLDLLGKIPFKGWQCVAELVDNSIDAIINNSDQLEDYQKIISVYIPTKGKILENDPLVIEDKGIGMTRDQLESAVKAGFSSKNTNMNLGLFGMGFNVATSRLANSVQVWTSTAEMDKEIGVCINLREMKQTGSFYRPQMEREKKSKSQSGTRIEIYDYKSEALNLLQAKQIIREINRAYSERIFSIHGIKIKINDEHITPYQFCIWDRARTVKHKYDEVSTYIEIDKLLGQEMFCENCFSWLDHNLKSTTNIECPHCLSDGKITAKDIYITGWVGIQRFSDTEHYGIDISRNGRILSKLDKSFFSWEGEKDDPRFNPEYPRDTTYAGGRIVGQLEANFVVPKYTKDDFERDDQNWKRVIKHIRGDMPLQPDLAKALGYKMANRTPIGMLFNAYRKINLPGSKTLCFAKEDGSVDHKTPKNWATHFFAGEPEYQYDTKWWEAVIKSDLKETSAGFDPLNPDNASSNNNSSGKPVSSPNPPVEKYPGKKILKKPLKFDIESIIGEKPIELTLIDYYPENEIPIPIIFESQGTMWKFNVYLNNDHPMFKDFADGYEDLIYMEVASKYSQMKNLPEWTVTRIYYELKSKYAIETMLNVPNLVNKANSLMREVHNKLVAAEGFMLPRKPNLSAVEESMVRQKYLDMEGKNIYNMLEFTSNTKYLNYLDLNYLFTFVEEFPELVYDGIVFKLPYSELDEESRAHQLKKYAGWFGDVKWFMNELAKESDEAIKKLKPQIVRNRYSIDILHGIFNK